MSTLMYLYLIGALVTFVGVLIAAPRFDRDSGYRWRHRLAAVGAVLWPIMVVGVIQLGLIAAGAAVLRRRPATQDHAKQPTTEPVRV